MRGDKLVLLALMLFMAHQFHTEASAAPSTSTFMNAMTVCAAGSSINIDANLEGSIISIYEKSATKGRATQAITTEIQKILPQTESYKLYVDCLKHILDKP